MAPSYNKTIAVKPHSAPKDHNQSVADPVAHFKAIPWCAALLEDGAVLETIVPDRRPLASGESSFVRKTMNTPSTVRACVTFFRTIGPPRPKAGAVPISKSKELLGGGGRANGEDPRNPFLLFSALVDLGVDTQGYEGTLHGGLFGVLMDEVMATAANFQSENGAYTINMTTHFLRSVRPPEVILVRGRVVKRDGRKLYVRGTIEDKDGNLMGEADGLMLSMPQNVGRSQL